MSVSLKRRAGEEENEVLEGLRLGVAPQAAQRTSLGSGGSLFQDYRDRGVEGLDPSQVCSTCHERAGIDQEMAGKYGLNWEDFARHPRGHRSCWACKNAHQSMTTETHAPRLYGKEINAISKTIFGQLQRARMYVTQKKPTDDITDLAVYYYWLADINQAVLENYPDFFFERSLAEKTAAAERERERGGEKQAAASDKGNNPGGGSGLAANGKKAVAPVRKRHSLMVDGRPNAIDILHRFVTDENFSRKLTGRTYRRYKFLAAAIKNYMHMTDPSKECNETDIATFLTKQKRAGMKSIKDIQNIVAPGQVLP